MLDFIGAKTSVCILIKSSFWLLLHDGGKAAEA